MNSKFDVQFALCTLSADIKEKYRFNISGLENQLSISNPDGKKVINLAALPRDIRFILTEDTLYLRFLYTINRNYQKKYTKILTNTYISLIKNAFEGIAKGYKCSVLIEGAGYKAAFHKDRFLEFFIGFSHTKKLYVSERIAVQLAVSNTVIHLSGIDKHEVTNLGSKIIKLRKHNVYKGNGIRYLNQKLILKPINKKK